MGASRERLLRPSRRCSTGSLVLQLSGRGVHHDPQGEWQAGRQASRGRSWQTKSTRRRSSGHSPDDQQRVPAQRDVATIRAQNLFSAREPDPRRHPGARRRARPHPFDAFRVCRERRASPHDILQVIRKSAASDAGYTGACSARRSPPTDQLQADCSARADDGGLVTRPIRALDMGASAHACLDLERVA